MAGPTTMTAPRDPQSGIIATDFFVYNTEFSNVLAGTSQTNTINIQSDSDFEVQKLTALILNVNSAPYSSLDVDNIRVLIVDTGTGRQLSDVAVPIDSMFGTGQLPFILPNTKLFKARSVISVQVTNSMSGYNYSTIMLSFIGRKVFRGYQ